MRKGLKPPPSLSLLSNSLVSHTECPQSVISHGLDDGIDDILSLPHTQWKNAAIFPDDALALADNNLRGSLAEEEVASSRGERDDGGHTLAG